MSHDTPKRSSGGLLTRVQNALNSSSGDEETRELARALLTRAERAMRHLEGASATLERAAELQLSITRRMLPIVEDLGELMKHTLDEARERRGVKARHERSTNVIDVEGKGD